MIKKLVYLNKTYFLFQTGKSSLIECFQNPRNKSEKHTGMATDGIEMSPWVPQDDLKVKIQYQYS